MSINSQKRCVSFNCDTGESTSKRTNEDNVEIDPETAKKLFETGATLILLNVPTGTEIGIDMQSWRTGPQFQGIKMIPSGLHFIYFSAVSKEGSIGPRTGFFHHFAQKVRNDF